MPTNQQNANGDKIKNFGAILTIAVIIIGSVLFPLFNACSNASDAKLKASENEKVNHRQDLALADIKKDLVYLKDTVDDTKEIMKEEMKELKGMISSFRRA